MNSEERFKLANRAAYIGIIGNIFLAILKGIIGVQANSRALVADAVNSATDVAGSLAVLVGLKAAQQPPDEDHPYGHGKAESIAAIIVAVLIFLVGLEIGKSSIEAFFQPISAPSSFAIFAILISIAVKEALFQYTVRLGKRIKSDALIVTAHDHRSDVFASSAVLIGVGASILGDKFSVPWLTYADPLAGIVVAILILTMAWKLGAESIHNTLDHVLHEEDTVELKKMVRNVEGVLLINEFHAREHGHYVIIDLKVAVDPYITVEEGHKIGKQVKKVLLEEGHVQNVFVHINPFNEEDGMDVDGEVKK